MMGASSAFEKVVHHVTLFRLFQLITYIQSSAEVNRSLLPPSMRIKGLLKAKQVPEHLGKGGFGTVFSATLDGQPVAVKTATPHKLEKLKTFHERVANEIRMLMLADHAKVVRCFGGKFCGEGGKVAYIVMEKMTWDLSSFLIAKGHLMSLSQRATMSVQVCLFLTHILRSSYTQLLQLFDYLRLRLGVIHSDIKAKNLLTNNDGSIVKLADFGISRDILLHDAYFVTELKQSTPHRWTPRHRNMHPLVRTRFAMTPMRTL